MLDYDLLWRFTMSNKPVREFLSTVFTGSDDEVATAKGALEDILQLRVTLHARRGQRGQAVLHEFGLMLVDAEVHQWIAGAGSSTITLELKDGIIYKRS